MKKTIFALVVLCLLVAGCSSVTVKQIKDAPDQYVGKEVTLSGTSSDSIKIGKLSGFTLTQEDGSKIAVSTPDIPADGSDVKVTGTVVKDTLFGVYILASKVN